MLASSLGSVEEAVADAIQFLLDAVGWIWTAVVLPVAQILDRVWALLLAGVAVVVLLRALRWLLLLWRGRTPRVQISPFAWTTSEEGERESAWVTSLFREQLAALRLDALDPLPERAPGAQLV